MTKSPVRMHSRECDKAGITVNAGEIPGSCIFHLKMSARHLTKAFIVFESDSKFVD